MQVLISASSASSGAGRRPRSRAGFPATRVARLERATPRASARLFTACRPEPARASATAVFWLRQIERLAQDLVLQGLLAEQPLQFANLMLQGPIFGSRYHFFTGTDRRQRPFSVKLPPLEYLVRRHAVLPRH